MIFLAAGAVNTGAAHLKPSLGRESSGFSSSRSDEKDVIKTANGASVILGKIAMPTIIVPARFESAINEVEFDRLLDAVRAALAPSFNQPPSAANDNELVWPLIPFPEIWWGCEGSSE